jgi:hypothetical protein
VTFKSRDQRLNTEANSVTFNPSDQRLYKKHLATRYNRTPRSIDQWAASGKIPAPCRDETGRPFWWASAIAQHELALAVPSDSKGAA